MDAAGPESKLDWPAVARGASAGLTVLVLGGLVQPLVGMVLPPVGKVWLIVVAMLAFAIAGRKIGGALSPVLQGRHSGNASGPFVPYRFAHVEQRIQVVTGDDCE